MDFSCKVHKKRQRLKKNDQQNDRIDSPCSYPCSTTIIWQPEKSDFVGALRFR